MSRAPLNIKYGEYNAQIASVRCVATLVRLELDALRAVLPNQFPIQKAPGVPSVYVEVLLHEVVGDGSWSMHLRRDASGAYWANDWTASRWESLCRDSGLQVPVNPKLIVSRGELEALLGRFVRVVVAQAPAAGDPRARATDRYNLATRPAAGPKAPRGAVH